MSSSPTRARAFRSAGALATMVLLAALPANAGEIVPHRAVYGLELAQQRVGAGISGVDGRMFFQWEDVCDAWTIEQRYRMNFVYSQGGDAEVVTTYATWESKTGERFTFNLRRETNGIVDDEFRGAATLSDAEGGSARYRIPEEREVALPPGTFFPTAHSVELMRRAAAGETFFSALMFDGTEAEGLTELSAVIGRPLDGDETVEDALLDTVSWPVEMAFFDIAALESTPIYEISVRLFDNGIIDTMEMDYGDFVIRASLLDLERLPPPDC